MIAKLKTQCPKCTSEIFIEEKDKPINTSVNGKTHYITYKCPVCGSNITLSFI